MCKISNLYSNGYIDSYLKENNLLIANACDHYDKETFNEYKALYEKYKDEYLCEWFPKLWAIVFYKNEEARNSFLETIMSQVTYDSSLNAYNAGSVIKYEDNKVVIVYNSQYSDYITLDESKDVG